MTGSLRAADLLRRPLLPPFAPAGWGLWPAKHISPTRYHPPVTARRVISAVALWAASGLPLMHAATTAASPGDHGEDDATALSLCVFILAGGGMVAIVGTGPTRLPGRPRHRGVAWSRVRIPAPLLPRRRPVAWCVLRA